MSYFRFRLHIYEIHLSLQAKQTIKEIKDELPYKTCRLQAVA